MDSCLHALGDDPSLAALLRRLQTPSSTLMEGLTGGSKGALLTFLAERLQRDILVVSGSISDALYSDTLFFQPPALLEFPAWDTLPEEELPPSVDLVGKRLEALHMLQLSGRPPTIVLAPLQAALQPVPRAVETEVWAVGQTLSWEGARQKLTAWGYVQRPLVSDKGEFAVRGGIIDLFPLSSDEPIRLEWDGEELGEIRTFDPVAQTATGKRPRVLVTAAREGSAPASLWDYLAPDALIVCNELLALEDQWIRLKKQTSKLCTLESFFERAETHPLLLWSVERAEELSDVTLDSRAGRAFYSGKNPFQPLRFESGGRVLQTERLSHPFLSLQEAFSPLENRAAATEEVLLHGLARYARSSLQLHLVTDNELEREQFIKRGTPLPPSTQFHTGTLSSGFFIESLPLAFFPLAELHHRAVIRRQKWRAATHTPASDFHEISAGDLVVHYQHGIGKYLGLEKMPNHAGVETEFLLLEYAEKGRLLVPVAQSHLISRYIGAEETVPMLSQLGSLRWQKTRLKAQTAIIGYADQLLRQEASRAVVGGFAYPPDSELMLRFERDFPFIETDDQLSAIAAVKRDMESTEPMDRLICGDVGYGKTEVALRAAFKAVMDGKKQVALLVPTTILALQHYDTFTARLSGYPCRVASLTRMSSLKEKRSVLNAVKAGEIDILIGTHRLLSADVLFHNLGLLIIDEEQRFGVRAKEHIKQRKVGVDTLTLSATPIPRTLYLSLVGARPLSTIHTPPQDRLPIKSILARKESGLIRAALLRELAREGQAYVLHNRIETLPLMAEELQKLLPEARIVTAHGQMDPDELDTIFHSFKSGAVDILVATTLIENGVDIPNANTLLVDRADTFGLADLYQMRGRVGRWNRPAYAYFLVNDPERLPDLARKRLIALTTSSGFGAGMKIALRDLEIRGAGDILGTQQSGHVSSIGFHLYCKLLKKAVHALKAGRSVAFTETKMEFSYNASLPESYIADSGLRMEIYHRFGEASEESTLDGLLAELTDRFGPCPLPVLWLYHLSRLRLFASTQQFISLKFDKRTLTAERQVKKETLKKTLLWVSPLDPAAMEREARAVLTQSF